MYLSHRIWTHTQCHSQASPASLMHMNKAQFSLLRVHSRVSYMPQVPDVAASEPGFKHLHVPKPSPSTLTDVGSLSPSPILTSSQGPSSLSLGHTQ